MAKAVLRLVSPDSEKPTVGRRKNAEVRQREHLTPDEVERLAKAAAGNRYGQRDALMIRMTYRHGLRVSELVDLRWTQIDFTGATLLVRRLKGSKDSQQPIQGDELRVLRSLRRDNPDGEFVFLSERGAPFSVDAIQAMIKRLAKRAGVADLKPHPHMLRHACGHKLASEGQDTRVIQDYLGHVAIQHTVKYTELAPNRFKKFKW